MTLVQRTRNLAPASITQIFIAMLIAGIGIALLLASKPWQIGAPERISDFVRIYSWWAGLINILPLAVLLLTARKWARPLRQYSAPRVQRSNPSGFRATVLGAMLVCAVFGAMRLGFSLWDDEEYSVRRAILGTFRTHDDGTVKLKELPWSSTLWYYTKPTNHIFQSILSRLSLSTWRAMARPKGLQLNEIAMRIPSYAAGILSVGAIALLMARVGFPWAGALGAWLLAIHPWHLRLAPEARGYGVVFLLIPVICLLAINALERGSWRWWSGLALAEFVLIYTWPPSVILVFILNVCVGTQILLSQPLRDVRGVFAGRWLASGTFAAAISFQLLLPCVPQFLEYSKSLGTSGPQAYWLKNVGFYMFIGSLWSKSGRVPSPYLEFYPDALAHPTLTGAAIVLVLAFLVTGIVTMLCRRSPARWLVAVFLIPGLLLYAVALLKDQFLEDWYLCFMLPGLTALVAVGILRITTPLAQWTPLRFGPGIVSIAILAGYALFSWKPRMLLLARPVQSYRESVLLTRPNLDPNSPENRAILTATTLVTPAVYDPLVRKAKTLEDYAALIKEAEERGVPLYVNNGFPAALKDSAPEVDVLLGDESVFERIGHFYGTEERRDREVYRYRPGSLKNADPRSRSRANCPKVAPRRSRRYC